jgi:hypothetical protein
LIGLFQIKLLVELYYYPELYPSRVAELRESLVEDLIKSKATLDRFIKEKSIDLIIEFLAPEMLESHFEV